MCGGDVYKESAVISSGRRVRESNRSNRSNGLLGGCFDHEEETVYPARHRAQPPRVVYSHHHRRSRPHGVYHVSAGARPGGGIYSRATMPIPRVSTVSPLLFLPLSLRPLYRSFPIYSTTLSNYHFPSPHNLPVSLSPSLPTSPSPTHARTP